MFTFCCSEIDVAFGKLDLNGFLHRTSVAVLIQIILLENLLILCYPQEDHVVVKLLEMVQLSLL